MWLPGDCMECYFRLPRHCSWSGILSCCSVDHEYICSPSTVPVSIIFGRAPVVALWRQVLIKLVVCPVHVDPPSSTQLLAYHILAIRVCRPNDSRSRKRNENTHTTGTYSVQKGKRTSDVRFPATDGSMRGAVYLASCQAAFLTHIVELPLLVR
jgi:hypothetical protein